MKTTQYLSIFLLLFHSSIAFAFQDKAQKDTIQAKEYFLKGNTLLDSFQYDSAQYYFQKASVLYQAFLDKDQNKNSWTGYVNSENKIAIIDLSYKRVPLPLSTIQPLLTKSKTHLGEAHPSTGMAHYTMGFAYYRKSLYDLALENFQAALDIQLPQLGSTNEAVANSYNGIGLSLWRLNQKDKALDYFLKSLSIKEQVLPPNHASIANSLNNIGLINKLRGNFTEALKYYDKSLQIKLAVYGPIHFHIADTYENIGNLYFSKSGYNNQDEHFATALDYYDKCLNIRRQFFGPENPLIAQTYGNIALVYGDKGLFDKSLENFEKELAIVIKNFGEKNVSVANVYMHITEVNYYAQKNQKALAASQRALQALVYNFNQDSIIYNPPLQYKALNSAELVGVLLQKGKVLTRLFNEQPEDTTYLSIAYQTLTLAMDQVDILRQEYTRPSDKKMVLYYAKKVYDTMLFLSNKAYTLTKEKRYLQKAFEVSEKNKSILLLDDLTDQQAKSFTIDNEDILTKETSLNQLIVRYEKELYEKEFNDAITHKERITLLQDSLFHIKQAKDSLIQFLEEKYPDYYNLKNSWQVASLQETQAALTDDETALIEYYVNRNWVYAFFISKTKAQLIPIRKKFPLVKTVRNLQKGIYQYHLSNNRSDSLYQAYADTLTTAAHQLYQQIIAPIEEQVTLPKKLVIVADNVIGYIPFDLLLKNPAINTTAFSNHDYLINEHQISYAYSATLLQKMQERQHTGSRKNLLAFAPSFTATTTSSNKGNTKNLLNKLKFNIPEVQAIQQLIGGDIFTDKAATESTFLDKSSDYKIIHISTHGKANEDTGDYAYLAFTEIKDSIENEFIYNQDLYNMRLKADLVVLSACETGVGEIQEGEGIISLARGFSYAGAKSIITTLWSVDDAKTKEIMEGLYTYFSKGMAKDVALRQTKLDFIEDYGHQAHPFYWAAFIPLGDMSPIDLSRNISYGSLFGGGIAFLIFLLVFGKFRKSK